jgi:hypothetical protein
VYRRLGQRLGSCATRVVFVTGSEHLSSSKAGAREGGLSASAITVVRTVQAAIAALPDLGTGDVVLIKGRHTQRFQRISLALSGRDVRCDLEYCNARLTDCGACPMLGRAWSGIWIDGRSRATDRRTVEPGGRP